MNHRHGEVRRCVVFHGHGETLSETCGLADRPDTPRSRQRTIADTVPLRQIMSNAMICARTDLLVSAVIKLMVDHHVGCLPVIDARRRPVGVITKFDLVEQLDLALQAGREDRTRPTIAGRTAEDVMMPIALTLPEDATVAHAASMMISEDTHHVLVVANTGVLVGVVSTRDLVGWLVDNDELYGATS